MSESDGHDKPTMREWLAQVRQIKPRELTISPAEAIRIEREQGSRLDRLPRRDDFIVGDPEDLVSPPRPNKRD